MWKSSIAGLVSQWVIMESLGLCLSGSLETAGVVSRWVILESLGLCLSGSLEAAGVVSRWVIGFAGLRSDRIARIWNELLKDRGLLGGIC